MRELTFRIFDKKNKRMIDKCGLIDIDSTHYDIECEDFVFNINGYEIYRSNMVVNSYTGLNDINGKMIYEGDILKTYTFIGVVSWDNFFGCWRVKEDGIQQITLTQKIAEKCEIIGNIYQNPELLDENKER